MIFIIFFAFLFNEGNSFCIETIEIGSKKSYIFTFTNKINQHFRKDYEYCIKISNKKAAIFMNNAIAKITVSSGSDSENLKINEKKSCDYFFLPTEKNNTINFKVIKAKQPFSVSFISFPDECDISIVSNYPEKIISSKEYHNLYNKNKPKNHVCYFSGFPFETQLKFDESIKTRNSLKFTSSDKFLHNSSKGVFKSIAPTLIEWDISSNNPNDFEIQISKDQPNILNDELDRSFKYSTKIYQVLNDKDRIIMGKIKNSLDKLLLAIILSIFAFSVIMIIVFMSIFLYKKGICCVKTLSEQLENDSDQWEVSVDLNDNELVFRKPYIIEGFDDPYSNDKERANMIKKSPNKYNSYPVFNFKDSINDELLPNSD